MHGAEAFGCDGNLPQQRAEVGGDVAGAEPVGIAQFADDGFHAVDEVVVVLSQTGVVLDPVAVTVICHDPPHSVVRLGAGDGRRSDGQTAIDIGVPHPKRLLIAQVAGVISQLFPVARIDVQHRDRPDVFLRHGEAVAAGDRRRTVVRSGGEGNDSPAAIARDVHEICRIVARELRAESEGDAPLPGCHQSDTPGKVHIIGPPVAPSVLGRIHAGDPAR